MSSTKVSYPWVDYDTKKMLRRRDKLYKISKKNGYAPDRELYLELKRQTQKRLRRIFWDYLEKLFTEENFPTTPEPKSRGLNKKFWSFIKHRRTESCGISPLKDQGKLHTDPQSKAEILNKQFQSAFSQPQGSPERGGI
jgi:hypothetical protein